MRLATKIAFGLIGLVTSTSVATAENTLSDVPEPAAEVSIEATENPDGTWDITYEFAEPQSALVLSHAPVTYRDWTPLSEGVTMWRIGGMEGFAFREPASDAKFRIQPFTGNLPAAYTPFLAFSDGSFGVLSGQFRVKPIASLAEAVDFKRSGEEWPRPVMSSQVSITSARPVSSQEGGSYSEYLPAGNGTFVYVGSLDPVEGESFRGYIDPGLPAWLTEGFDADLGRIFSMLADGWGQELKEKGKIFMVFRGYENEGLSLTGGAIGDLLSLQMSGSDLVNPIPEIQTYVRWFLAHEAAHIFQRKLGYEAVLFSDGGGHAWVHEGSANTFAYRIGADLADDPEAFLTEVYASEYSDCVAHLETAPLVEARESGNFRAYYACGDLIALATDAMLPKHDLYDFWNALQAASIDAVDADRAKLYFQVLEELGAPPEGVELLRSFVWQKPDNPTSFVLDAMASVGLPITLDAEGEFAGMEFKANSDRKSLHR